MIKIMNRVNEFYNIKHDFSNENLFIYANHSLFDNNVKLRSKMLDFSKILRCINQKAISVSHTPKKQNKKANKEKTSLKRFFFLYFILSVFSYVVLLYVYVYLVIDGPL